MQCAEPTEYMFGLRMFFPTQICKLAHNPNLQFLNLQFKKTPDL